MILEICANSYQSALNAQKAGANRIELCSELAVGGITPSHGLIEKVVQELSIPVYVLIRPRSGDFTYSSEEFDIMKRDIEYCKKIGCSGIVSGVLQSNSTIDVQRTEELIKISRPLPFTFHRAFDWVVTPENALEELISINADRILTSGQQSSALQGADMLRKLLKQSNSRIQIMPGGGINRENVLVFKENGFTEIHFSAASLKEKNVRPKISMNSKKLLSDTLSIFSDFEKIKAIKKILEENT
ncbi:copper homeostasis protein CutC [Aquimarina sp. 2201CG5-10]|uniref:copper homeostasis protein CutC n=1 Tax=Aquimarina callyspongiae TaxID=3098150 RepID=UPI002AB51044|nr:copper homeostasis protein CutC [Aquimarina sp. 2201CG5-10]MDY8134517.1 copper homeostasis protein CutC [Aquimarina sp. 2201CG5-10]